MLSIPHMIVVFIVVLVVFGPNKLPELARGLGKLMAEFRKASTDFKGAFEQEMRDIERQTMLAERKKAADLAAAAAAAAQQPATQATPAGTETAATEMKAADDASSSQSGTPSGEGAKVDTRTTEALVATPAVDTIARGVESTRDSHNGVTHISESQAEESGNSISHPNQSESAQADSNAAAAANNPAHDTQQPA
jgi:sec-independent protein translocase protein TatB